MTYKRIELGRGVWEKMQQRGLSRRDIREALALGTPTEVETYHGEQRLGKVHLLRGRSLLLVYIERAQTITIVSFHDLD